MCSRFILQHPIMSPSMMPWCMVSSWQRKSASGTLSASATPISWCSNARGLGMQRMQIWQATLFLVQQLSGYFEGCEFHHIPRANNEATDALSKLGSTRQAIPPGVSLEHIKKPSITPSPESESIFISETDLEALRKAKEAQSAKIPTLKKQPGAQGAPASAEPAAPGAADCIPGAAECSKKRKAKGKQAEATPDGTASEEPMTSGTADYIGEGQAPDKQKSPGAAECAPDAAVSSSTVEVETGMIPEA